MSVAFKFTIFFKIRYHTNYGESICVLGNTPDLGKWNLENGVLLNWSPGDEWTKKIVFVCPLDQIIEYKYVISVTDKPERGVIRWEDGPNRELNFLKSSYLEYFLDDTWNFRKVVLRIKYDLDNSNKSMYVVGNAAELGYFSVPQKMELVLRKDPSTKVMTSFWEKQFLIESVKKRIRYYYLIYDEKEKKFIWERDPGRIMCLRDKEFVNYKKSEEEEYGMDCMYFKQKNSTYKKIDINFISLFFYNRINENIFIGPYPSSKEDIDKLIFDGIRAVFNLQTSYDMKYRSIEWESLKNYYVQQQLEVVNFQIIDMNYEDMKNKGLEAVQILRKLIDRFEKVYVHCTAGIGRAPQTVILYLCLYKKYSLDEALDLIKKKRCIANPNKKLLQDILSKISPFSCY